MVSDGGYSQEARAWRTDPVHYIDFRTIPDLHFALLRPGLGRALGTSPTVSANASARISSAYAAQIPFSDGWPHTGETLALPTGASEPAFLVL
jgi:hypothetical protein